MPTVNNINNLVINKVPDKTLFDQMVANNLINENEIYFVGEKISTSDIENRAVTTDKLAVGIMPRVSNITLTRSEWSGLSSPFSQVVSIDNVTATTRVELMPTIEQIGMLQSNEITLLPVNDNGVVTVYAHNGKLNEDLTMQVLLSEVVVE